MKKIYTIFLFSFMSIAHAQDVSWLNSLATSITAVVPNIIIILSGISLVYFIWGMILFLHRAGSDQDRIEGRKRMVVGVIALTILFSTWGLVALFQELSGIGSGSAQKPPQTTYE